MQQIEKAVSVLESRISSIHTVSEWAEEMNCSSSNYFSRVFRNHYGKRPKEVITEKKLEKIKECIAKSPDEIYYSIARQLGFVDNNALYKFVKRNTGKSPSELKRECEKGV